MKKGNVRMVKDKYIVTIEVSERVLWLPLSTVYFQVKEQATSADIVQRFRNNVMYRKYNIETQNDVRCMNVKDPMKDSNCSVVIQFTSKEDKDESDSLHN